jgi:hypothetical protein
MGQQQRSAASALVDCSKWRVPPKDYQARIAERDARLAADTRDATARYFGDPEPSRSALYRKHHTVHPSPRSHAGTRIDLWKR